MRRPAAAVAGIAARLAGLQLIYTVLRRLLRLAAPEGLFAESMVSMAAMLLLFAVLRWAARRTGRDVPLLPGPPRPGFWVAAAGFGLLLALTLLLPQNRSAQGLWLTVYGSIVTPLYEEYLFRGLIWRRLEQLFAGRAAVAAVNAVLFGLWHLGYADGVALRVDGELGQVMFWKVLTGLAYGAVLAAVRCRVRCCGWTVLLHGAMNLFGR